MQLIPQFSLIDKVIKLFGFAANIWPLKPGNPSPALVGKYSLVAKT